MKTPPFDIAAHTIFKVRHGSHAYGTNRPDSDLDSKGILVCPKSYVLGFYRTFEQWEIKPSDAPEGTKPEDVIDDVTYEIRKFCGLAAVCNPNIIEVFFVDDSDILYMHPVARMLRDRRNEFLSRRVQGTFSGYAFTQLGKIYSHRKWLLDPPTKKPTREDFGLDGSVSISPDMIGAIDKIVETEPETQFHPNVMQIVQAEKQYRTALKHYSQYESWKRERNEARSVLEGKFGYDTKHAMHLVRLLRMCREIITGQGVQVKRKDAAELLAIRNGEWSYDRLIEWAEKFNADTKALAPSSPLPEEPDFDSLSDLCLQVQERFWKESA